MSDRAGRRGEPSCTPKDPGLFFTGKEVEEEGDAEEGFTHGALPRAPLAGRERQRLPRLPLPAGGVRLRLGPESRGLALSRQSFQERNTHEAAASGKLGAAGVA